MLTPVCKKSMVDSQFLEGFELFNNSDGWISYPDELKHIEDKRLDNFKDFLEGWNSAKNLMVLQDKLENLLCV